MWLFVTPGMFKIIHNKFFKRAAPSAKRLTLQESPPTTSSTRSAKFPPFAHIAVLPRGEKAWRDERKQILPLPIYWALCRDLYSLPLLLSRAWISRAVHTQRTQPLLAQERRTKKEQAQLQHRGPAQKTARSIGWARRGRWGPGGGEPGQAEPLGRMLPASFKTQQWGFPAGPSD